MSYVTVRESIRDFIMDPFHDLDFRFSNAKTLTGNDILKRAYPANPGATLKQFIQADIYHPVKIPQFPFCKFYMHLVTNL